MSELYDDLGVAPDASPEEIKAAHRRAAKKTHPDTGGSRDEFEKIQRAYMVLSDPDMRARYDRGEDMSDGPDNFEAGVASILCSCFIEAMQQGDIVHENIIELTRDLIAVKAKEVRRQIDHAKVVIDKLTTISARLSVKGDRNIIGHAIASQKRDAERGLASLEDKLKAHIAASNLCNEFDYKTDPRDPPPRDIWGGNVRPPRDPYSLEEMIREATRPRGNERGQNSGGFTQFYGFDPSGKD